MHPPKHPGTPPERLHERVREPLRPETLASGEGDGRCVICHGGSLARHPTIDMTDDGGGNIVVHRSCYDARLARIMSTWDEGVMAACDSLIELIEAAMSARATNPAGLPPPTRTGCQ